MSRLVRGHFVTAAAVIVITVGAPLGLSAQEGSGSQLWDDLETQEPQQQEEEPSQEESTASGETQNDEGAQSTASDSKAAPVEANTTSEETGFRRILAGTDSEGGLGFHHFAVAKPTRPKTFRVAIASSLSHGSNVIRARDENSFLAGHFLFQAMLTERFSLYTGLEGRNNTNTFGRPQSMLSQGDWHLGARGHLPLSKGVYLGGDLTGYFPASFQSAGLELGGTSLRPRVVLSLYNNEMSGGNKPKDRGLVFTGSLAYRLDGSSNIVPEDRRVSRVERTAQDISEYDRVESGVALAYQTGDFRPYGGLRMDVPLNASSDVCAEGRTLPCVSDAGFGAFPKWASAGVVATPLDRLALTAGVDISLTTSDAEGLPVTLPYTAFVEASWTIDPEPPAPESNTAFFQGTVVNAESGNGIEDVRVAYTGKGVARTPQATNANGEFVSYEFDIGTKVEATFNHPDFESSSVTRTISKKVKPVKVELEPKPQKARLKGKVVGSGGEPLPNFSLQLSGDSQLTVQTASDGTFDKQVQPGLYEIRSGSKDYEVDFEPIEVEKDGIYHYTIPANKKVIEVGSAKVKDGKIEVSGDIVFESGESNFTGQSRQLLDDVAELLTSNPGLGRIRVEGHTDDEGSEDENQTLSQQRAQRVREYLINQGVSSDRLDAKGYGSSQPLVPNFSEANRELNRRVEFKILN